MPHLPRLVLASASPARLTTLRAAGLDPVVEVSNVDEDAVLAAASAAAASHATALTPAQAVLELARAKAEAVAQARPAANELILGCDSMLEFDGAIWGKPAHAQAARERWQAMRGRQGVLHTGHWLMRVGPSGGAVGATGSTVVHFAAVDDADIDAYVATGEPLAVAGAFTVDGLGGAFVERIEGDYHNVVGVSVPLLRELMAQLNVRLSDLWAPRP